MCCCYLLRCGYGQYYWLGQWSRMVSLVNPPTHLSVHLFTSSLFYHIPCRTDCLSSTLPLYSCLLSFPSSDCCAPDCYLDDAYWWYAFPPLPPHLLTSSYPSLLHPLTYCHFSLHLLALHPLVLLPLLLFVTNRLCTVPTEDILCLLNVLYC